MIMSSYLLSVDCARRKPRAVALPDGAETSPNARMLFAGRWHWGCRAKEMVISVHHLFMGSTEVIWEPCEEAQEVVIKDSLYGAPLWSFILSHHSRKRRPHAGARYQTRFYGEWPTELYRG